MFNAKFKYFIHFFSRTFIWCSLNLRYVSWSRDSQHPHSRDELPPRRPNRHPILHGEHDVMMASSERRLEGSDPTKHVRISTIGKQAWSQLSYLKYGISFSTLRSGRNVKCIIVPMSYIQYWQSLVERVCHTLNIIMFQTWSFIFFYLGYTS